MQTHPHQPDANSYVLLLDVGHSIFGTATSSRRYARRFAFFFQFIQEPHPDLMVFVILVPRVNLALEH
jgi:hypothetical protein